MTATELKNSIVKYKGGGYEGCYWEFNYAYFDADGVFHCIAASGRDGCETEEALQEYIRKADDGSIHNEYDVYALDDPEEVVRFGIDAPISHLIGVANALEGEPELTAVCSVCGNTVNARGCEGDGIQGIGGMAMQFNEIICADCHSKGSCSYCGDYFGEEEIDGETGYCTGKKHDEQWCLEKYGEDEIEIIPGDGDPNPELLN